MTLTVAEMKTMRLDLALTAIADMMHDVAHERFVFEQSYAKRHGCAWSTEGERHYRAMCAAEALIRTLVTEARKAVKASGATPPLAVAAGEAARREWTVCHVEGERLAFAAE